MSKEKETLYTIEETKTALKGKDTNVLSNNLIDRQAAISIPLTPKGLRKYQTCNLDDAYDEGWGDYQACISQLPSAQPEIIHCRECKYKMLDTSGDEWICSHPSNNAWRITANHYCGYAERREE